MASTELAVAFDSMKIQQWLDQRGIGSGAVTDATALRGGTQNILIRFDRGQRPMVLRRPSLTPRDGSNRVIAREAEVLAALSRTPVPHPELIAFSDQEDILDGSSFYIMAAVDGINPVEEVPHPGAATDWVERVASNATRSLAGIGSLDYDRLGLKEFGRPEGFLARQVPRWAREWERYLGLPGYPGIPLPHFTEVRNFLSSHTPEAFTPGLMHGDYHLGNLIVDPLEGDVNAVVDWEMSTIGDPLLDLGRYLATWPDEHEVIDGLGGIWLSPDLPHPDSVVHSYAQHTGRDVPHRTWYVVLGCYKLGVILEGTYARACAGHAPMATGVALHRAAQQLFERAARLISS